MTRWEAFAKAKGILKKKKKERMTYDEETGTYKPIFGYKSRQSEDDWIFTKRQEMRRRNEYRRIKRNSDEMKISISLVVIQQRRNN